MPNTAPGPKRTHLFIIHDDLWHAAQTRAHDNGETVSDVVRRALTDYTTVPELEEEDA